MTFTSGSRIASPTAASTSSGIGGTIVFRRSGRLSVIVAVAPSAAEMIVSKEGMDGIFSPRSPAPCARAALLAAPIRTRANELRPAALGRDDLHLELAPRQAP